MRTCTKCKTEKAENLFKSLAKHKNTGTCKECKNLSNKVSYRKHRKKRLEYHKAFRKANYEKVVATNRLAVSKIRFGINRDELIKPDTECGVCSINQTEHLSKYGLSLNIHHVDGCGRSATRKGDKPNNDPKNLELLCQSCHTRTHNLSRINRDYSDPNRMKKAWVTRHNNLLVKV